MTWDYFNHQKKKKNPKKSQDYTDSQALKTTLAVQILLGEREKETLLYSSHGAKNCFATKTRHCKKPTVHYKYTHYEHRCKITYKPQQIEWSSRLK